LRTQFICWHMKWRRIMGEPLFTSSIWKEEENERGGEGGELLATRAS
jgi:hypothetical protein